MDTHIKYAKAGLGLVIGSGVGTIVKTIIQNHVQPETKIQKLTVFLGRHAIQSVAAHVVNDHVEKQLDKLIIEIRKNYQTLKGDN